MSRPPFQLTDDQARALLQQLAPILARHPIGAGSHRPFVRDFVRAVHTATGRTYSPAIYRRLLDAYAPDRRPSTDTLAQEKNALVDALGDEAHAGRQLDADTSEALAHVVQRAVDSALARQARHSAGAASHDRYADAQRDFLQARLADAERQLNDVRTQAARLAGEAQAAHAVREALQAQVDAAHAVAAAQSQRIERLASELAGMRTFALNAVDAVRGETRAWQDRCASLDAQLKQERKHLEAFRQIAYRRGAPIPPDLLPEDRQ